MRSALLCSIFVMLALPLAITAGRAAPSAGGPLDDLTAPHAAQAGSGPADSAWHDIRVQVVAHTAASLGSPMSGRLGEFPLRDGERFEQGQVLAASCVASRKVRWLMPAPC